ncbi:Uncharacterised protein [Serratia grimesii]|nr:Uncharacterised protein [Serratia grimesii]
MVCYMLKALKNDKCCNFKAAIVASKMNRNLMDKIRFC